MQNKAKIQNKVKFKGLLLNVLLSLCLIVSTLCPAAVFASDSDFYAHDANGTTKYYSIEDAWQAALDGKTIVLDKDWNTSSELTVSANKTVTLNMNKFTINRCAGGRIFYVSYKSTLKLIGDESADKTFQYRLSSHRDWSYVTSGGFITGGSTNESAGAGIYISSNSTLEMKNVALAGNYTYNSFGAGVYMETGSNLKMTNAYIDGNLAENSGTHSGGGGAGVCVGGKNCTIDMSASSISDNFGNNIGGAIYSKEGSTTINMKNKSKISNNGASMAGGAIYFNESFFQINGDGTSSISSNYIRSATGRNGSAIGMDSVWMGQNEGKIQGITFDGNSSGWLESKACGAIAVNQEWIVIQDCKFTNNKAQNYCHGGAIYINNDNTSISNCTFDSNSANHGGAIYIDNEDTTITNCTFTNNTAGYGGAIYNNDDNTVINNCTIKNNSVASKGGGIYTDSLNDITLKGKVVIKENSRWSDTVADDDLFLDTGTYNAYAKGNIDKGSEVGIRTDVDGDRRVVKELTNYIEGAYFLDQTEKFHISYGKSDSDLWQRSGSLSYLVTVNGSGTARYSAKTSVTTLDNNTDKTKAFKSWSDESTGINLTDEQKSSKVLTFKMPGNDVHLKADYITRIKNVWLVTDEPKAGEDLPNAGTFNWVNLDTGEIDSMKVSLSWREVSAGGQETYVSGKAKYNTSYKFELAIAEDVSKGLAFDFEMEKNNAQIYIGSENKIDTASVNSNSGTLKLISEEVTTQKAKITKIEKESISIQEGESLDKLKELLPAFAIAVLDSDDTVSVDTDIENITLPDGLLDGDNNIVKPDGGTIDIEVPVITSEIDNPENLKLTVTITVTDKVTPVEPVATPEVDKEPGTYKEQSIEVKVQCPTENAEIFYQIDDGDEQIYSEVQGIVLNGEENTKTVLRLKVWAQKDSTKSEILNCTYILDNESEQPVPVQTVTITCRDSGSSQSGSTWSDTKTIECDQGSAVNITAPTQEGRKFAYWEWGEVPSDFDTSQYDISGSEVSIDSLSADIKLNAIYNPIITELDFTIDEPKSNMSLPATLDKIMAGFATETELRNVTSYFCDADGNINLTWSPSSESGKADYDTVYTVSVPLNSDVTSTGAKYVLSDSLQVKINGENKGSDAYVTQDGDAYILHFTCSKTAKASLKQIVQPDDINISFEQACKYQAAQDEADKEGSVKNCWDLPFKTSLILENGEEVEVENIDWDIPRDFDIDDLNSQSFTVQGTLQIPSYIDSGDLDNKVSVVVNVGDSETTEAPVADVLPGEYEGALSVGLSSATDGATIYYTLDGSEPTTDSTVYDSAKKIKITKSATIKAIAVGKNMKPSEVAEFNYTIKTATPADDESDVKKNDDNKDTGTSGDVKKTQQSADYNGSSTGDSLSLFMLFGGIVVVGAAGTVVGLGLKRRRN